MRRYFPGSHYSADYELAIVVVWIFTSQRKIFQQAEMEQRGGEMEVHTVAFPTTVVVTVEGVMAKHVHALERRLERTVEGAVYCH